MLHAKVYLIFYEPLATDIEDRPQPPEFDTVPDVDDLESDDEHENATAIVDNDDEDDENDDL